MELGLLYYNARFYAPSLGRFLSADSIVPDPTNPQSLNRYSYTWNSPLNLIDPTGHRECGASDDCSYGGIMSPKIDSSNSWVNVNKVTMYQEWGNTDFSFGLGTSNTEPVDDNGNPVTKHPNYSYCNGFHCGIDQFAAEGTFVRAGIGG
ncbi:MAG: RHS repeat-associated core domain-containing protein [Chloroflexi bacterium]|nr:RHS repeat-associated core domain-containing protein [Chloroflexota bacterium]